MDQLTFQSTVFVHKDKLYRLAKRLLLNEDDAFDAVQNVMMKLWQMKDQLSNYTNIEAFAMQCVKNECFNRMKHIEVVREHQQQVDLSEQTFNTSTNNIKEVIVSLINELPPKQRMVMHLKDVEEYDYQEIASILEMEENAIRINLMRARQKIKVQLEKLFEYEQRQF